MLTIEKIKTDFSCITAWTGNSQVFHSTPIYEGYGNFCDLYFKAKHKQIKQEQVDKYNEFKQNFRTYLPEIESYILSTLKKSEHNLKEIIGQSGLMLDVIEVPYDNFKYDLVLVCGKSYKKFFILTRNIDLRVEFKNGKIKSIQRKKDTTEDNE